MMMSSSSKPAAAQAAAGAAAGAAAEDQQSQQSQQAAAAEQSQQPQQPSSSMMPSTTSSGSEDLEISSRRNCSSGEPLAKADLSSAAAGVIGTLREYLGAEAQSSSRTAVAALLSPVAAALLESQTPASAELSVAFAQNHVDASNVEFLYPFHRLPSRSVTYRGYPVDGPESLRGRPVVIQIVGAGLNAPAEPLPQFPQQELLYRQGEAYAGLPGLTLTPQQVSYNSGRAYLKPGAPAPTSTCFYTSGYGHDSAAQVLKPFPESIYETVLSGAAVQVSAGKH